MPDPFYVTTPIYYVNARPHIGHAYTTIVADVLARRARAQGRETWFLTGTDEHGQKIERSALAAGVPPQQFADEVSAEFRKLWERMGLTYDQYIRTTDEAHKRGVQKLFRELRDRGHIYLDSYTGAYCVSDETFVDVPAGAPCPDCGRPTETVTEENYFFRLSAFQQLVIDLIESGDLIIEPDSRRNEVLSFLRGGLKDLSISRSSFTWGIPVPQGLSSFAPTDLSSFAPTDLSSFAPTDLSSFAEGGGSASVLTPSVLTPSVLTPSLPAKDHVIYVWLDALANYITAIGYSDDSPEAQEKFQKFWPANLHIVGKEIIRFHCVYWPAFLLAAGLPTPKKIVAHGWLLFEESKMSKSRGNIVRTETILDAFGTLCPPPVSVDSTSSTPSPLSSRSAAEGSASLPSTEPARSSELVSSKLTKDPSPDQPTSHDRDLFAADVLRYFLLREIPFGQDGSFSFDALITRYNADLANGYGNLVSRTLNMINRYFEGSLPSSAWLPKENFPIGNNLIAETNVSFEPLGLTKNVTALAGFVSILDAHLSEHAPWKLATKTDAASRTDLEAILYRTAESIRIITALLYPILPCATANVWRQLGLGDIEQAAAKGELNNLEWGGLKPGTRLGPLSPIFPRADKGLAQIMTDMENEKNAAARPAPSKFVDETFAAPPVPAETFDPAAGPRTASLDEPNPGALVAGSSAETTDRPATPSHVEAEPSGIFASLASTTPVAPAPPADASAQITIDDFAKVELRVAQVVVCERIPKADKLLRLEVDLGYERRQILSGIAEWYTPEDLIGRRIVVITNLAPRKMRGLDSHGMLLAASGPEGGKPALATFLDSDAMPLGSRLK